MERIIKRMICFIILTLFFISTNALAITVNNNSQEIIDKQTTDKQLALLEIPDISDGADFDPLVDVEITFTIKMIRAFEKLDPFTDPDFYVKLFINDEKYTSPTWNNKNYVKDNPWSQTVNVPDTEQIVTFKIQLCEKDPGLDQLCDISRDYTILSDSRDVELNYSIATGQWYLDDINNFGYWGSSEADPSGRGRFNGCDDGSIHEKDLDCELWFDITQNDYDNDGIPYWAEVNIFETDPEDSDLGRDDDNDGVPFEWEYKWGFYAFEWGTRVYQGWIYDPLSWENHSSYDDDKDGLDNVEEYLASTEGFWTDPFRQDILLEIDQMEEGPNGEGAPIPELTYDLLWDSFAQQNIIFHVDDDGRVLPFDDELNGGRGGSESELDKVYYEYFLNGDLHNWRHGAFHYGVIPYNADYPGYMWGSNAYEGEWDGEWSHPNIYNVSMRGDCFLVETEFHDKRVDDYPLLRIITMRSINKEVRRAYVYAVAIMHETGHVLGLHGPGIDNRGTTKPWSIEFWIWIRYMSCMNYQKMYYLVDYSDGSRGKNDHDDWARIDLTQFEIEENPYYQG